MDKQVQMKLKNCKPSLTDYQQGVNTVAENICLKNPSMIRKHAELLESAQQEVHDSGYVYRKGRFGTSDNTLK